ncbi:MAG: hypothetical protein WCV90_06925 [Candidatus Woesearchaeota archaeon]
MSKNNSTHIGDRARFEGDVAISGSTINKHNSPNVHASGNSNVNITYHDNVKRYKGKKLDTAIYDFIAPILMEKIGEKKLTIFGIIDIPLSILGIFGWLKGTQNIAGFLNWIPALPYNFVIYLSSVMLILGAISLGSVAFFYHTKCKNEECEKTYAYVEHVLPDVEEVDAREGTHITTKREFKCKYCGHIDKREDDPEFIPHEKEGED